jgi:DHA1 family inner membrane transport protein
MGLVVFATALFTRITDPLVSQMAAEFAIDARTVALLGTAFALPYAAVQPVFGAIADRFGKTRVVVPCVATLVLAALVGALATSFSAVLASRIIAGIAAGGVFPIAIALVADLMPVKDRMAALTSILFSAMIATILGAVGAGFVGDYLGWRGVFVASGLIALGALIATPFGFRGVQTRGPVEPGIAAMVRTYWMILRHPLAKVCYGAVLIEGAVIYGYFPYVAPELEAIGEQRAMIAGIVLSGFAVGGIFVSLTATAMLTRFGEKSLMIGGGLLIGLGLIVVGFAPPWTVQTAAFLIIGIGFFSLHSCIQIYTTELAPQARGSAMSLHSTTYFLGQALGPPLYSLGLTQVGLLPTAAGAGLCIVALGFVCAATLRHRRRS